MKRCTVTIKCVSQQILLASELFNHRARQGLFLGAKNQAVDEKMHP
jgi:hypothetical protein